MKKFEKNWLIVNAIISLFLLSIKVFIIMSNNPRSTFLLHETLINLLITNALLYFLCVKDGSFNFKFIASYIMFWAVSIFFLYLLLLFYALTFMGFH